MTGPFRRKSSLIHPHDMIFTEDCVKDRKRDEVRVAYKNILYAYVAKTGDYFCMTCRKSDVVEDRAAPKCKTCGQLFTTQKN